MIIPVANHSMVCWRWASKLIKNIIGLIKLVSTRTYSLPGARGA